VQSIKNLSTIEKLYELCRESFVKKRKGKIIIISTFPFSFQRLKEQS